MAPRPASDVLAAVEDLAGRVLGSALARRFRFGSLPDHDGRDVFVLEHRNDHVSVRGNSGPALAAGLNHYLTHKAGAHFSWPGSHPGRVAELPDFAGPIRRESWARWRYFLNACCYSYSLAYWTWEDWEPFLDRMALWGVNLPLALTGQEAVWVRVGRRLGLSEAEIRDFLPGAAYLPFGAMGCLDGWTGPLSDHWISEHEALGRRILQRQRELGMTPVLPGFSGHVPAAVRRLFRGANFQTIRWLEWETTLVDPLDPLFQKIAAVYGEEQKALFGTDHHYAADPFIEMIPPSGEPEDLAEVGRAIYRGMAQADPEAVWVLQGWPFHFKKEFWTQGRIRALLDAVPDDRMLVLDLFCEFHPMWDKTEAFCGKPWLWCNVQSFGSNVVLTGALQTNNRDLPAARNHALAGRLTGLGMVNEGLCPNPAAYDFFFERAWWDGPVDLAAWGRAHAAGRYGRDHPATGEAWEILATTALAEFRFEDSGLVKCPTLPASVPSREATASLIRVWDLLLSAAEDLKDQATYGFDVVHIGRQVLSDLGNHWKSALRSALTKRDAEAFGRGVQILREGLKDLESLLATRPEFQLEAWIRAAENWGTTEDERKILREGALRQITLWGNGEKSLRDYARKEWAGLISSYYRPRWEAWFSLVQDALASGADPDEEAFRERSIVWEREWNRTARGVRVEAGGSVAVSLRLLAKYRDAFGT